MMFCNGRLDSTFKIKSLTGTLAFSVFFFALTATLMSGCMKPESRSSGPDVSTSGEKELKAATFIIPDEIKGVAREPHFMQGFSIPVSKLYNFTACLKNSRTRESLIGHKFLVSGGEREQIVQSDAGGCVNWSERVSFNFLSDAKYVPLVRKIVGQGMQSGAREVRIAVNPWNLIGRPVEIVDLTHANVPAEYLAADDEVQSVLEGRTKTGGLAERNLLLTHAELQTEIDETSTSPFGRRLSFWMKPGVMTKDVKGEPQVYDLKEARLRLAMQIRLVTGTSAGEQIFDLFSAGEGLRVNRIGDFYRAQGKAVLDIAASHGHLMLLVRVSPIEGPPGLKAFDAVYEIGATNLSTPGTYQLKLVRSRLSTDFDFDAEWVRAAQVEPMEAIVAANRQASPPVAGPTQDFKSRDKSAARGKEILGKAREEASADMPPTSVRLSGTQALPSGVTRLKPFEMSMLSVGILGVDEGETAMTRTMRYYVLGCLKDLVHGGNPARDVDFSVTTGDGRQLELRTMRQPGMDGCIRWEEAIKHKYYESEHFVIRPVIIRHASGFEERRELAINPWDRFSFGRDTKEDPAFIDSVNRRERLASRLLVNSFNVDSVDTREYEIDPFLNLKTIKRFRLRLPMQVQRYSNIFSGRSLTPEPLRGGLYLLRAAVYAQFKDPSGDIAEIIAPTIGGDRLIRVRGGEAKVDLDFAVSDPRLFKVRGNLVLEVLPVDEERLSIETQNTLRTDGLNLDGIIDKEAGLDSPTYVGALWLREEGGGASLYPADDLLAEENGKVKSKTGSSPVAQAVLRPLAGITVAKLMAKHAEREQHFNRLMRSENELHRILTLGNLEYLPLNNEALAFSNPALKENNRVIPTSHSSDYVLRGLNRPPLFDLPKTRLKEPVTSNTLVDLIEGRRDIDRGMAERLCLTFFDDLLPRLAAQVGASRKENLISYLLQLCAKDAEELSPAELFTVDRKVRVFEIGRREFKGGFSMAMSMGADVGFARTNAQNISYSIGFSPLKVVDTLSKAPALNFLNIISATGVMAAVQATTVDAQQITEGSSFRTNANINMEQVNIKLEFKKYESCAAIRVNPLFWERHEKAENLLGIPRGSMLPVLTRGIFVCSGVESAQPMEKVERYYSFAEGQFDGTQLDGGDLRNHPWLLALRGQGDYANFLTLVAAKKVNSAQITENVDPGVFSIDRLNEAFAAYRGVMQSVPGVYTVEKELPPPRKKKEWYQFW
jgi:hypothetical protein